MGERGDQWVEILSWEPRAFLYHNFLVSFCFCNLMDFPLYQFDLTKLSIR